MELEDTAASRVSIGFPLGLALLFACLLFVCGFFCCWLHWKKLQSLFQSSSESMNMMNTHQPQMIHVDSSYYPHKPAFPVLMMKQNYAESLPVLMPGDEVPKFIAMACPCQPPKEEKITIHVQKEESPSEDFCNRT